MENLTINEKINVRSYFQPSGNKYHFRIKQTKSNQLPDFAKTDKPFNPVNMFYILINQQAKKSVRNYHFEKWLKIN